MIEKICDKLTQKIRKQNPEIDAERAEVINYGLQLIIGEVPKLILLFAVAIIFKIAPLVIFAYMTMLPYKVVAGGFHLKTNIGCTLGTFLIYYGNVFISKSIIFTNVWQKLFTSIIDRVIFIHIIDAHKSQSLWRSCLTCYCPVFCRQHFLNILRLESSFSNLNKCPCYDAHHII